MGWCWWFFFAITMKLFSSNGNSLSSAGVFFSTDDFSPLQTFAAAPFAVVRLSFLRVTKPRAHVIFAGHTCRRFFRADNQTRIWRKQFFCKNGYTTALILFATFASAASKLARWSNRAIPCYRCSNFISSLSAYRFCHGSSPRRSINRQPIQILERIQPSAWF